MDHEEAAVVLMAASCVALIKRKKRLKRRRRVWFHPIVGKRHRRVTFNILCRTGIQNTPGIQVYNIISGVHDSYSSLPYNMCNVSITRGDQFKMQLMHIHCILRKHFLPAELRSIEFSGKS